MEWCRLVLDSDCRATGGGVGKPSFTLLKATCDEGFQHHYEPWLGRPRSGLLLEQPCCPRQAGGGLVTLFRRPGFLNFSVRAFSVAVRTTWSVVPSLECPDAAAGAGSLCWPPGGAGNPSHALRLRYESA
jgi:hypothetical protein